MPEEMREELRKELRKEQINEPLQKVYVLIDRLTDTNSLVTGACLPCRKRHLNKSLLFLK